MMRSVQNAGCVWINVLTAFMIKRKRRARSSSIRKDVLKAVWDAATCVRIMQSIISETGKKPLYADAATIKATAVTIADVDAEVKKAAYADAAAKKAADADAVEIAGNERRRLWRSKSWAADVRRAKNC